MTRIAVFGAGGVGGYFGARLARARRLLARCEQAGFQAPWAIRNQGEAGS